VGCHSYQGQWTVIGGASLLRLIGGAVAGFLFAYLLGLEGPFRQVAIVGASMPTGVTAVVLATEFESDAQVVSSTVLFSTLLSLLTLPIIIFLVS
jgi:malate permease and related proteins